MWGGNSNEQDIAFKGKEEPILSLGIEIKKYPLS